MTKPIHVKPSLYAYYFLTLKEIALQYGYNLVIHGSLNRDMDLIAIPWQQEVKSHEEMIDRFAQALGGHVMKVNGKKYSEHPHHRKIYVINLNRGGYKRNELDEIADPIEFTPDPQYYLDISVMPAIGPDQIL